MLFSFVLGTVIPRSSQVIPGHPNDEPTADGAPAALAQKFAALFLSHPDVQDISNHLKTPQMV